MKFFYTALAATALACSVSATPAQAQCGVGCGVVVGVLGGTILGNALSQPRVIYTQPQVVYPGPQTVIVQQAVPVYIQPGLNPTVGGHGCWQQHIGFDPVGNPVIQTTCN